MVSFIGGENRSIGENCSKEEQFEDAKGVIRSHTRRPDNAMTKRKSTESETMIYKTFHRKQH